MQGEQPVGDVRVLYGPPRPVLVVTVRGPVDGTNQHLLLGRLRYETAALGDSARCRERYGIRRLATAVVLDLSAGPDCSGSTLRALADCEDGAGRPLRLVVPADARARATISDLGLGARFDLYEDLLDAVLSDLVEPE